jgi:hypothetical protein
MTYCKLHIRLTAFPQRSCKCCRTEHVTPNRLAWGNVKNEMNDFTIRKSFSSHIILHFISTSHSNTTIPQSQVTVVKLIPFRLLPRNLSVLECLKTYLSISVIDILNNEAEPHDNPQPQSWDPSPSHYNHGPLFHWTSSQGYYSLKDTTLF